VERRAEVDRAAGVADWDPTRGDLPEIRDECCADVPLEAQPRSGTEGAGRVGAQESGAGLAETGRGIRAGAGAEGLGGGCVKKSLRAQGTQITRGNLRWLARCSIV